ncbi:MAG: PKD domain-containing protein [Candidatus Bathyarchaeia archaeon]
MNETVTFSAPGSTDGGYVEYYFFDFGDETNSSWTTSTTVKHQYAEKGLQYNRNSHR